MKDVVADVFAQLGKEAGCDEGRRSRVDSGFALQSVNELISIGRGHWMYLAPREANCYHTDLTRTAQEF